MKTTRQKVIALPLIVVGIVANVQAKDLFLLHADGPTVDADFARGDRQARPVPANNVAEYRVAETAPGRWGRSVDLRPKDTTCVFDAEGNFDPERGTVEFWFRIDAHEKDMYHPLFGWYRPPHQPGNRTRLSGMEIYIHHESVLALGLHTPESKSYEQAVHWQLDKWHHLEIGWDCTGGDGQSVYRVFLDGKKVIHVNDGGALAGDGGKLHLGIWDYGWGNFLHGRIDELRITDQVEHLGEFIPPPGPYAVPNTLDHARQAHRLAHARLGMLRAELAELQGFAGTRGNAADADILRSAQETSAITEAALADLQSSLNDEEPDVDLICGGAEEVGRQTYAARLAIDRVSAPARALAAEEDKRSRLFKSLNEDLAGDAVILDGKQLFIDDDLVQEVQGVQRVLNRPTKHPRNPLVVPDLPWEEEGYYANGTVLYDEQEKLFKAWIHMWKHDGDEMAATRALYVYLTSHNGIDWTKPHINPDEKINCVKPPSGAHGVQGQGLMKDPLERDPARRYKMMYTTHPAGDRRDLQTGVAYSPDGIAWTADAQNPVIPFGDSQNAPLWDARRGTYVAFVRTGPPNLRGIARIESRDFTHWSPKITVFPPGGPRLDALYRSIPYGMKVMSYAGHFIGLLSMYHWETIAPIPEDKLWQDKVNVQLAFSRDGIIWNRVGPHGVIRQADLSRERDWKAIADNQVFLQYGEHQKEWDWGQIYAYHAPVVFDDKIWIYYTGIGARHWSNYHDDDRTPHSGMGLATLRLDGFVSVETEETGWLLTRPLIAIGDTLVVNADADGGSLRIEALDALGRVIKGFSKDACTPITGDSVRHVVTWNGEANCHPLQGRPVQLRFHLENAKLYAFEFEIRRKHYISVHGSR